MITNQHLQLKKRIAIPSKKSKGDTDLWSSQLQLKTAMQFPISRFLTSSIPDPDATALQPHSVQLPLVSNYILDIDNPSPGAWSCRNRHSWSQMLHPSSLSRTAWLLYLSNSFDFNCLCQYHCTNLFLRKFKRNSKSIAWAALSKLNGRRNKCS